MENQKQTREKKPIAQAYIHIHTCIRTLIITHLVGMGRVIGTGTEIQGEKHLALKGTRRAFGGVLKDDSLGTNGQ
jgi:hypothetical protein